MFCRNICLICSPMVLTIMVSVCSRQRVHVCGDRCNIQASVHFPWRCNLSNRVGALCTHSVGSGKQTRALGRVWTSVCTELALTSSGKPLRLYTHAGIWIEAIRSRRFFFFLLLIVVLTVNSFCQKMDEEKVYCDNHNQTNPNGNAKSLAKKQNGRKQQQADDV